MRPRTIAPIVLLAASLGTAHADSPKPANPTLVELRGKLWSTDPDVVRKDLRPFRALCDDAGYPLVGNAATASKMQRIEPSKYCTLVREEQAKTKSKARK